MLSNILKQTFRCALSIALFTAWTGTMLGQTSTAPSPTTTPAPAPTMTPGGLEAPVPAGPQGEREQSDVDRFLMNHPGVSEELHKDPSLINNPQWLSQHPEVNEWMKTHPSFAQDAKENPNWLVNHEESKALSDERHGVKTTDAFMANHPMMAKQLEKDPSLIDNKEYLAQHPQLNHFLETHPEIAKEWHAHPGAFTKAAERGAARPSAQPHPVGTHPVAHTGR